MPSDELIVESIIVNYYPFEKDVETGTYTFNLETPGAVIEVYKKGLSNKGTSIVGSSYTFEYTINVEQYNGSLTRTAAGRYEVIREYTSNSIIPVNDPLYRKLVFIVDRNGIISEPDTDQNGNSIYYTGSAISLQIINNFGSTYDNPETLHFYDIYFASKLSKETLTPVLKTNLLPVTVYIPSYKYGYNISIIKTDNTYNKINVNSIDDAYNIIKMDFDNQKWKCMQDIDVYKIEKNIESNYFIASVDFCDVPYEEANKIANVITKMYTLFPNVKGALTNISISNANTMSEYIAYFQPMYQFVNSQNNINEFNKVNKTQILLNSYYFLNKEIMQKDVAEITGKDWYVMDATWESTIAHEFGHYITFKLFLKNNNLDNITFVDNNNEEYINDIMKIYDSGSFSMGILLEALENYNTKYHLNLTVKEYAAKISKYAAVEDKNGNLIVDETIAEAIHDYYLHGDNSKEESNEIILIIRQKLGD